MIRAFDCEHSLVLVKKKIGYEQSEIADDSKKHLMFGKFDEWKETKKIKWKQKTKIKLYPLRNIVFMHVVKSIIRIWRRNGT